MIDIVEILCELNAAPVLIHAAYLGFITEIRCEFEDCDCPQGRNYFDKKGSRYVWAPSADRFPVPGREGGKYEPKNVRIMHSRCNLRDGGRVGGRSITDSQRQRLASAGGKIGGKVTAARRREQGLTAWGQTHAEHLVISAAAGAQGGKARIRNNLARGLDAYGQTPEQNAANGRAQWERMTPEDRQRRGASISAGRAKNKGKKTDEERRAAALLGWETRRRRQMGDVK